MSKKRRFPWPGSDSLPAGIHSVHDDSPVGLSAVTTAPASKPGFAVEQRSATAIGSLTGMEPMSVFTVTGGSSPSVRADDFLPDLVVVDYAERVDGNDVTHWRTQQITLSGPRLRRDGEVSNLRFDRTFHTIHDEELPEVIRAFVDAARPL
jgi:hypothetical protein